MSERALIKIIEEQAAVSFTGKLNVLSSESRQLLGELLFYEGDLIHARYTQGKGFKALVNLFVDENIKRGLSFVVEPEIVDANLRSIHYPISVLKRKIVEILEETLKNRSNRPPNHLKIMIRPDIIGDSEAITPEEFEVLSTMSDFNLVKDIYEHCLLLDFEITNALVSLRKKNALTVVQNK